MQGETSLITHLRSVGYSKYKSPAIKLVVEIDMV